MASAPTPTPLTDELTTLLRSGATCYLSTLMPDGSPQLTQVWVDTDGQDVLVNTVVGHQKARNVARDPRVTVAVSDPARPSRYSEIRGRVSAATTDGAAEHIELLAQRYLGGPYPWFGGRDQQRLLLTITPERINSMG
ncbi:PPOX class F420-dependent oxidoreductase [Auraticoccus monumenti]|uniref:PPOX class probable F420-dependent enzyme n=1 Tax=Auraticoccus monumenti TaxID=675864 RepID=A0A1G6WTJ1_9ACTN|nr:PPOX class F420-dependent oxidoreductase [Auraticoccus monumenti]SDD68406.1 PPOX class probable F420-dependent enzyme [Auraticoccus monumenti]